MNARRLILTMLASLCVPAIALAFASAPASALAKHVLTSTFGEKGSGAGQLSSPDGVAVNTATHDVYVADRGNLRVDEFSSTGSFLRASGWGVADGLPMFETCTAVSGCEKGLEGSAPGEFTTPAFVAVDNSGGPSEGDVYVGDVGDNVVSKFTAEGVLIEPWGTKGQLNGKTLGEPATDGPFEAITGVAVDTGGTLTVDQVNSLVFKYFQDGTFSMNFGMARDTSPEGLGVDAEGNIFTVSENPSVEETTGSGADIGKVTLSERATGVAFNLAPREAGGLYVDVGNEVEHYILPSREEVEEEDHHTLCKVAPSAGCNPSDTFGAEALEDGGGLGIGADPVNGDLFVTDASADRIDVFAPLVAPPSISEESSENVLQTSATLHAEVNPNGHDTTYRFEYGTSTAYGTSVPAAGMDLGSVEEWTPVSQPISGLEPGAVYYYRVIATSDIGTTYGPDQTFTTFNATPDVLPDERQYELVSPPNKNGGEVDGGLLQGEVAQPVQASENGNAITYQSSSGFESAPGQDKGSVEVLTYLSKRGPSGWSTENITVPYEAEGHIDPAINHSTDAYEAMSPDLSAAFVVSNSPLLHGSFRGYMMPYRRNNESSAYQALSPVSPSERIAGLYT